MTGLAVFLLYEMSALSLFGRAGTLSGGEQAALPAGGRVEDKLAVNPVMVISTTRQSVFVPTARQEIRQTFGLGVCGYDIPCVFSPPGSKTAGVVLPAAR